MNVIRNLAAWIVRSLLWLRYDISLIGKEKLLQREGVLILPNHPGELDPVIVFSHLWNPMQPRGMAVEDFYHMPVLNYLMQMLRVIPMPNMYGGIGSYKKYRVRKALKACSRLPERRFERRDLSIRSLDAEYPRRGPRSVGSLRRAQPGPTEENLACSHSWIDGQFIFMGCLAGNTTFVSLSADGAQAFADEPDFLFATAQGCD